MYVSESVVNVFLIKMLKFSRFSAFYKLSGPSIFFFCYKGFNGLAKVDSRNIIS